MSTKLLSMCKRLTRALPLSGLMLLSAGWTVPLNGPQSDANLSKHMSQKFDAAAAQSSDYIQLNLDLSDSRDWAFLMGRLQSAGKSEKNAPELFKRLGLMRSRAMARKADGSVGVMNGGSPAWCNHFFKMGRDPVTSNGNTTFYPVVEVACKDGAEYVYADLINSDVNNSETQSIRLSSASAEQYGGGLKFDTVTAPATVATGKGRNLRMESLMIAADATLDQTSYILERAAATNALPSFSATHPRKIHTTTSTRAEIVACQMRGASDCDYAVGGYVNGNLQAYALNANSGVAAAYANSATLNPSDYWAFGAPYDYQKLYVPVRGTLSAGADNSIQCIIQSVSRARLQMIAAVTGRTCYNETSFASTIRTGVNSSSINVLNNMSNLFNTAGSGTSPNDCRTETIWNEPTRYSILMSGTLLCNGTTRPFFIQYPRPTQGTANIIFLNSCMAEGTSIKLADGKVVPVEQVKKGDKVISDSKGTVLTVSDTSFGNEAKPLFRIQDDAGNNATLTETHPVIKESGEIVAAKNLKVNDRVRTAQGISTLTSISFVAPKDVKVYNLKVGTDDERLKLGKSATTLFAGGFLVGDMSMQADLDAPKPAVASFPAAWQKDYNNRVQLKN